MNTAYFNTPNFISTPDNMISGSRTSKSTEATATPVRIFLKLKKVMCPTDQPNLANLQQNTIRNHYQPPQIHKFFEQQQHKY